MLQNVCAGVLVALIVAGCGTASVNRAQTVASAGNAYVDILNKVNETALDESITFAANVLPSLPRDDKTLNDRTAEMRDRARMVGEAKSYFDTLGAYFFGLAALAQADESEEPGKAVSSLADTLKKEPFGITVSDEKKAAVSGLTKYIIAQKHAAAVEKALRRDAETVGFALAVSEEILDEQIHWIDLRERAQRAKDFEEHVRKPFIAKNELKDDWKKAWMKYVRPAPINVVLRDAKEASVKMQQSWKSVLAGEFSFTELLATIKNVQAGLDTIAAVKDAK